MSEASNPPPTAKETSPVVTPQAKPAPVTIPAPAMTPSTPPSADTNFIVISVPEKTTPDMDAKLREAVEQKWQEVQKSGSVPQSGADVYQPLPANVAAPQTPVVMPASAPATKPSTTKSAKAPAVEKPKQTKTEMEQKALSKAVEKPVVAKAPSGFAPLVGPALPVTASQQEQLNNLLQLYQTDQITPEQYHDQRAKILGEN